jgi:hypothetical protein
VACRQPQPVFRPGGGHHTSGWAGAVKAGARAVCAPPAGLGLDRRSPPSRYTLSPPGRAGVFCRLGAPGGRTGALAPQGRRGGCAAAAAARRRRRGVGGEQQSEMGAARSPWKATQEPATRARRPTARAARERSDLAGVWGRLAPMSKRCLAAQPAAGVVWRRRLISRRADTQPTAALPAARYRLSPARQRRAARRAVPGAPWALTPAPRWHRPLHRQVSGGWPGRRGLAQPSALPHHLLGNVPCLGARASRPLGSGQDGRAPRGMHKHFCGDALGDPRTRQRRKRV